MSFVIQKQRSLIIFENYFEFQNLLMCGNKLKVSLFKIKINPYPNPKKLCGLKLVRVGYQTKGLLPNVSIMTSVYCNMK